MINGKRQRFFFKTKDEADTKASQLRIARKNDGVAGISIPEALRVEAIKSAELLQPFGISLLDAVRAYLPHLQAQHRTVEVNSFAAEFLAAKKVDGSSDRYLEDLKNKLDCFCESFGNRSTASIGAEELDDWLRALKSKAGTPVAALTRNNFRRVLVVAFNFAKLRRYCVDNPATTAAKAKEIETAVGILQVDQLTALLGKCDDRILPFVAMGAFAGLRTSELERLDWQDVDLGGRLIQVTAQNAKSARRRLIKIRPNLAQWLKPMVRKSGAVTPPDLRELMEAARSAAKIETWPHNALRHSFASYCLARENNAPALALEMGHTNTQMVFKYYREIVKPKDAKKYWKIVPPKT